jgi:hypothetical protein
VNRLSGDSLSGDRLSADRLFWDMLPGTWLSVDRLSLHESRRKGCLRILHEGRLSRVWGSAVRFLEACLSGDRSWRDKLQGDSFHGRVCGESIIGDRAVVKR